MKTLDSQYIPNYKIFDGQNLVIADKIQRLRLKLLIHSCIYYHLNKNIISDRDWDIMAKELVQLQKDYPTISEKVVCYKYFKDWDSSTGMDLPLENTWVLDKARKLLHMSALTQVNDACTASQTHITQQHKPMNTTKLKKHKSKLF